MSNLPFDGDNNLSEFRRLCPHQQLCSAIICCDPGTALLKGATLGCKRCCLCHSQSQSWCCLQRRHPKPRTHALAREHAVGNRTPGSSLITKLLGSRRSSSLHYRPRITFIKMRVYVGLTATSSKIILPQQAV